MDTAFVVWVEGKPYSSAAEPDMVILWRGGDTGRGRQTRSLAKPLNITPHARRRYRPLPTSFWPHHIAMGSINTKKVWVPRLAVKAKYESRN